MQTSASTNSSRKTPVVNKVRRTLRSSTRSASNPSNNRTDSLTDLVLILSSDSDSEIEWTPCTHLEQQTSYSNLSTEGNVSNASDDTIRIIDSQSTTEIIDDNLQFELDQIDGDNTIDLFTSYNQNETTSRLTIANLIDHENTLELSMDNTSPSNAASTNKTTNITDIFNLTTPSNVNQNDNKQTVETTNKKDDTNSPKIGGKSLECPICWESLANKQIYSTTCGHIYCKECIFIIIDTNKKCSQCRVPLNRRKVHQIFL